jgi:hypothetical protein
MQVSVFIHKIVADSIDHVGIAHPECRTMDPPSCFSKAGSQLAFFSLHQMDFSFGRLVLAIREATSRLLLRINPPFLADFLHGYIVMFLVLFVLEQECDNIKANASRTDEGHSLSNRFVVLQDIQIAQHIGMILTWNAWIARGTPVATTYLSTSLASFLS